MSETNRRASNVAIGNMGTKMHNPEGQYVQLGLTPPPSPSEHMGWGSHAQSYLHCHNPEIPPLYGINQHQQMPQYNSQTLPFNYVQSPNRYVQDTYEKCAYHNPNINNTNLYHQFYISQPELQENTYLHNQNYHENVLNNPSHTHLLENVVGNWVPNMTGTYSPFGNTKTTSPGLANIFDVPQPESHTFNHSNDCKREENDYRNFNFNTNRQSDKKPRIIAEVKPMRPSYSDVLTKPVVPSGVVKPNKIDIKDVKKKENKKMPKNEKSGKTNLHRLNSDIKIEKIMQNSSKLADKSKCNGFEQLNRRWSSLDNMHSSSSESNNAKKVDDASPINKNNKGVNKPGRKSTELDYDDHYEEVENKSEGSLNITKTIRKGIKNNLKQKGGDDKINAKRVQRNRKREKQVTFGVIGQKIKQYVPEWWKLVVKFCLWLVNLVSDICSLSVHLSRDMILNLWSILTLQWAIFVVTLTKVVGHMTFLTWIWEKLRKKKEKVETFHSPSHYSELENNIAMPSTGDEAMKRLLACKGKDPYSILGVMPTCSDDDIKRYYKRQAFLVHPDKNQQPGAEEAFKILVHAFDMIGEPELRARYDRGVAESAQVEQAWSKFSELLAQLQKKVEAAANTIRCSACGLRHKRLKIERPSYAARNCATCKIHHSAREGDIWAEAKCLGFLWHYYACMDGGIYDITEWAGCQKESLKHLKPNSHNVQYRIALGKQNGQQPRHSASPRNDRQPNLENLLNSLYGNKDAPQNPKRRNKKTK